MNNFKQFNIKIETSNRFEGDKIKISKILNKEIVVYKYKIDNSKIFSKKGSDKCLQLQISVSNVKHVIFTSSKFLIETIIQIPENGFPFLTTIVEEDDRYMFT